MNQQARPCLPCDLPLRADLVAVAQTWLKGSPQIRLHWARELRGAPRTKISGKASTLISFTCFILPSRPSCLLLGCIKGNFKIEILNLCSKSIIRKLPREGLQKRSYFLRPSCCQRASAARLPRKADKFGISSAQISSPRLWIMACKKTRVPRIPVVSSGFEDSRRSWKFSFVA